MSFEIVTEPIDHWPLPDTKPRSAIQFKAGYRDTLRSLNYELERLGARGPAVIQVVTRNGATDLRRDGALRAGAKIEHPGVRLSFESKHGPLTYATDEFGGRYSGDMPDWQANLRAIALGLEALRKIDRYGISKTGEQYRGWRAIGGAVALPGAMSPARAMEILRKHAGAPFASQHADEDLARLIKRARIGAHPDRHAGDHTRSTEVLAAINALGQS